MPNSSIRSTKPLRGPKGLQVGCPRQTAVFSHLKPVLDGLWLQRGRRSNPGRRVYLENRTKAPPRASSSRPLSRVRLPPPFRGLHSGKAGSKAPRPIAPSRLRHRNLNYQLLRHAALRLRRRGIPRRNGSDKYRRACPRLHLSHRRVSVLRFLERPRSGPCRVSLPVAFRRAGLRHNRRKSQNAKPPPAAGRSQPSAENSPRGGP
jgi:hypothetical protein